MKPETAAFLDKARECLAKADGMLDRWHDEAGREAYLAGLHATQALIVERLGKVVKTHRGVQRELALLTRNVADFDIDLRSLLARTYNLKAIADYETGPGSEVSLESATFASSRAYRPTGAVGHKSRMVRFTWKADARVGRSDTVSSTRL